MSRKKRKKISGKRWVTILMSLVLMLAVMLGIGIYKDSKEKGGNEKVSEAATNIKKDLPRIICWGDSLTVGYGGNGVTYPKVLGNLIKLETINYGVTAEGARTVAYRQGGLPMYVEAFDMPD